VNTRLQVEHPVTEAITGLDLVRMQIEIAQGAPLTLEQSDLVPQGHAIEARLYAEDAARDFLPVTGRVALLALPVLQGLRIDSGIEAGSEVSVHYDPMLAKVIAHGATREDARTTLVQGLRALAVGGLTTNREFLLDALEHPAFVAGDTNTHFIDRHFPAAMRAQRPDAAAHPNAHVYAIAATLFLHEQRRAQPSPLPPSVPSGFRNNRWRMQEQSFSLDDQSVAVRYAACAAGAFDVETQGFSGAGGTALHKCIVLPDPLAPPAATMQLRRTVPFVPFGVEIDGVRRRFSVVCEGERVIVHAGELCIELVQVPRFPPKLAAQIAGGCVAPMTGVVRKLAVAVGDRVAQGDLLLMLEAMKMEHRLLAQVAGVVKEVRVREGQMVDPDNVLVVVEALAD
jgi:propionyl-CoA carboxylase alpha chain